MRQCDELLGRTINLGSGSETSVRELAEVVYDEVGNGRVAPEFQPRGRVTCDGFWLAWIRLDKPLGSTPVSAFAKACDRPYPADTFGCLGRTRQRCWTRHESKLALIPITKPYFGPEEARPRRKAVESGWVSQGPKVAEFERAVADYCGAAHAVAVSNCTTALHLALLVLGVGPGDEVICPSMSFIATANSIRHAGATPVFADVDPQTYNLDPDAAEAAITPRTKAILVVHQIGLPVDLDQFLAIGAGTASEILEDAAFAIGSRYQGRPIGGHSEMACFSFHPRKVITTGEGGMIATNNAQYAQRLRLLRQHGMSVPDTVRHAARQVITEEYVCLGYNYRMTDIQAAVGIEQMKRLDWIVERRRELAGPLHASPGRAFLAAAAFCAGIRRPQFPELCGASDRRRADQPGPTHATAA